MRETLVTDRDFRGTVFQNVKFEGAIFQDSSFEGVDFKNANLSNTDLGSANLDGADLPRVAGAYIFDEDELAEYMRECIEEFKGDLIKKLRPLIYSKTKKLGLEIEEVIFRPFFVLKSAFLRRKSHDKHRNQNNHRSHKSKTIMGKG